MNRESHPKVASADSTPIKSYDTSVPSNKLAELALGRRTWARRYIERRTSRVIYGSTEWLMLPNDHADKVAACVAAAEAWAAAGDTLEEDIRREIALARQAHKRAEDEEYVQRAADHRHEIERKFGRPVTSFEERRTRQIEAAKPRPGDHPGGPAEWNDGA